MKISFLPPDNVSPERLNRLCTVINAAYLKGEAGMWEGDLPRTQPGEIEEKVRNNQVVVAEERGLIVGTVSVRASEVGDAGVFGMLAVDEKYTGRGIGGKLIAYAEAWAVAQGMQEMHLELLQPSRREHPAKKALVQWYTKLGYRPRKEMSFYQLYPAAAASLKGECSFTLWGKDLGGGGRSGNVISPVAAEHR